MMHFSLLYLDPGTGSLLLYAVVGITTTVLFALRGFWYSLRSRVFMGKKGTVKQLPDLVFQSEGSRYWQVFYPVLRALDKYGIRYGFVTSDKNDPVFSSDLKNVVPVCPGKELMTISYMNSLKAKVVVSTTPQLDVYMLKRSKHVKEYVHLFHAVADIGMYEMYAFDYYDTLLCTGPYQKESIRSIEKNRHERAKRLLDTGCTYFDYMLEELKKLPQTQENELTVLYAPAWGERSSVVRYGTKIIDVLSSAGIRVIFRPHPQMYVSDKETIAAVEAKIKDNSLIELDRNRTAAASMARSHVMVTDISGVIFDYAFLFERPIFLVNAEYELGGYDVLDVDGGRVWDLEKSREITRIVTSDEIPVLDRIIREEYDRVDVCRDKIRKIKAEEVYNFSHAGEVAARQLVEILRESI
ncbi:MAG: CDP-glycerol glycerophosphotransferase family protein [Spirochaetia bacterium]|nr:CDP-glycerol glycerophosphotransferase family protein [Spirochaetia bacterium]